MALINGINLGETTAAMAQAVLSQDTWLQAGRTCNDQYQKDAAGKITIPIMPSSDLEVSLTHRVEANDFNYSMLAVLLNNVFLNNYDVRGISIEALPTDVIADAEINLMETVRIARQKSALAVLATGTADTSTTATIAANVKANVLASRAILRKKKANADIMLASVDVYTALLDRAGQDFTPLYNDETIKYGRIGAYMGMLVFEVTDLDGISSYKYTNDSGVATTVDTSDIEYIMYDHKYFSVIDAMDEIQKSPGPDFLGTRMIAEVDSGIKITNADAVIVKKKL